MFGRITSVAVRHSDDTVCIMSVNRPQGLNKKRRERKAPSATPDSEERTPTQTDAALSKHDVKTTTPPAPTIQAFKEIPVAILPYPPTNKSRYVPAVHPPTWSEYTYLPCMKLT